VLDGLDLDVKRGEILGFVGPSGAGKSVLTRTIIGLMPKRSGQHRGVRDRSRGGERPSAAASSGAGASCSSRARCFRR
jgi:ABC-type transporter Mla maintaining outer membrane lipid asymmetry ATPase subunit MlaF